MTASLLLTSASTTLASSTAGPPSTSRRAPSTSSMLSHLVVEQVRRPGRPAPQQLEGEAVAPVRDDEQGELRLLLTELSAGADQGMAEALRVRRLIEDGVEGPPP